MVEQFESTEAHYSVPGLHKPFEVSGLLQIPKPAVSCINNYLNNKEDVTEVKSVNDLSRLPKRG